VGADQPVKLAAMEGLVRTQSHAPISVGGIFAGGRLHGALRIPDGLSLLLAAVAGRPGDRAGLGPGRRPAAGGPSCTWALT